ncbi:MAG: hypothetical protein WBA93_24140 [Microcoleaceae cyanobacterium]
MKAYSLDLRKKIIETYLNQESSIRQLAVRFQVAGEEFCAKTNQDIY